MTPPLPTRMLLVVGGDRADERFRAGAGEHRRAVMLRHPIARIAEPVAQLREIDAVAERVGAALTLGDRRLVEHAEGEHQARFRNRMAFGSEKLGRTAMMSTPVSATAVPKTIRMSK